MKSFTYLIAAILIIALIGIVFYFGNQGAYKSASTSTVVSTIVQNQPTTNSSLFNASQYFSNSFMLFPNRDQSAQAQTVTSDFSMTTNTLVNGTTLVKIVFASSNANYSIMVKQGYKL